MFPMDSSSISMIVAIVLLVTMSAYFSATETAFSCMNKIRMKSRAESGDRRALLAMDPEFRPALKAAGFLTRDPRMKERKKYGLKAARRAPQFSKR